MVEFATQVLSAASASLYDSTCAGKSSAYVPATVLGALAQNRARGANEPFSSKVGSAKLRAIGRTNNTRDDRLNRCILREHSKYDGHVFAKAGDGCSSPNRILLAMYGVRRIAEIASDNCLVEGVAYMCRFRWSSSIDEGHTSRHQLTIVKQDLNIFL